MPGLVQNAANTGVNKTKCKPLGAHILVGKTGYK